MPDEQLLTAMGNFNEELVKAGELAAREGLHPGSKGVFPVHSRARLKSRFARSLEAEDFGEAFTPELQDQEARLRAQSANNSSGRMPRPCRQAA